MPKYDLDRKAINQLAKKPIDSRFNSLRNSKHGEVKVIKSAEGPKLAVKYNSQWYEVLLRTREEINENAFKDNSFDVWSHSVGLRPPHLKNVWLTIQSGLAVTSSIPVSLTVSTVHHLPTDVFLKDLKFTTNVVASGDWGFRIYKHKDIKSDMTNKANYNLIWEHIRNFTTRIGDQHSLPVNVRFKEGDVIYIDIYGPTTSCFQFMKMELIYQNNISN